MLRGNLQEIFAGTSGGHGGSSGGGGAATVTTLPAVVQERLEEARGEEESESSHTDVEFEVGRFGVFISGEYENLDKDKTKFKDGYNSIIRRLTVGGDIHFSKRILAGLAFDTCDQDGRFKTRVTLTLMSIPIGS